MLTRVKNGATILDVGCCMGQDLRKLAADGASTDNMHGCDIETDFWDVGFDLFRDRETFKANYFQADVFDPKSFPKTLQGSVDIIFLGLVHHLWSRREQVEALASLARLTKPGSMILGLGAGWSKGREFETKWKNATKTMYYHDDETMKELWKEVGTVSGTRWKVDASTQRMETFFIESKDWDWLGPEARMSVFEATRMPIDANKL
ncbi:hypothetical protein MMC10_010445 [Thelotrema lepadinum]|nr:hypothetical protein [Thelotrema lepadinum]